MSKSLFIPSIILLSSLFACNVQEAQEGSQQQTGTPGTDQLESEAATPSTAPESHPEASATTVASAPAVDTQEEAPPPQPATARLSEWLRCRSSKCGHLIALKISHQRSQTQDFQADSSQHCFQFREAL